MKNENASTIKFKIAKERLESRLKRAKKIISQSNKRVSEFIDKVEQIMKEREEIEKLLDKQKEIETLCKRLESYVTKIDEVKALVEKAEGMARRKGAIDTKIVEIDEIIEKIKETPAHLDALEKGILNAYNEALSKIDTAKAEFEHAQKEMNEKIEDAKNKSNEILNNLLAEIKEIRDSLSEEKLNELIKAANEAKENYVAEREVLSQIDSRILELREIALGNIDVIQYIGVEPKERKAIERKMSLHTIILSVLIGTTTALFVTNVGRISKFVQSSMTKLSEIKLPKIEIKFEEKAKTEKIEAIQPNQPTQPQPSVEARIEEKESEKVEKAKEKPKIAKTKVEKRPDVPRIKLAPLITELKSAEYGIGIPLAQKLEKLVGTEKESVAAQLIIEMKEYLIKSGKWNGSWNEYQIKAVEDMLVFNGVIEE